VAAAWPAPGTAPGNSEEASAACAPPYTIQPGLVRRPHAPRRVDADPRKFQAALECLSFCDYSLAIKCGVHMTL
jgi:hypothetical protein